MPRQVLLRTTLLTAITRQQDGLAFMALYHLMCETRDTVRLLEPRGIPLRSSYHGMSAALLLDQSWQSMADLRQAYCSMWSPEETPCTYRSMVIGITYELRR
jgi:hypothetical protein